MVNETAFVTMTCVSNGEVILNNTAAGHLMRTKTTTTNEGGVAAGFAVLDSPLLI